MFVSLSCDGLGSYPEWLEQILPVALVLYTVGPKVVWGLLGNLGSHAKAK